MCDDDAMTHPLKMKQMTVQFPPEVHDLMRSAAFAVGNTPAGLVRALAIVGLTHMVGDEDFKQRAEPTFGDLEKKLKVLIARAQVANPKGGIYDENFTFKALENKRPPAGATGSLKQSIEEGQKRAQENEEGTS